ncbi:hypothetical protein JYU20_00575 [Bacteroidales bacterium AH-315-I05]|nr:hypothetical protein [Bacteroidales bacterium AH-315-I05]
MLHEKNNPLVSLDIISASPVDFEKSKRMLAESYGGGRINAMTPQEQYAGNDLNYKKGEALPSLANGVKMRNLNGGFDNVMPYVTASKGASFLNPIFKLIIDNTGAGNTDQTLRIGGPGLAGVSEVYGLGTSAADNAVITDQGGTNVKAAQRFSRIVSHIPVIVSEVQIESADLTQLAQDIKYRVIQPTDGETLNVNADVQWTKQKADQNTSLIEAAVNFYISANWFLDYTIKAGKTVTVSLKLSAVEGVDFFLPLNGRG